MYLLWLCMFCFFEIETRNIDGAEIYNTFFKDIFDKQHAREKQTNKESYKFVLYVSPTFC